MRIRCQLVACIETTTIRPYRSSAGKRIHDQLYQQLISAIDILNTDASISAHHIMNSLNMRLAYFRMLVFAIPLSVGGFNANAQVSDFDRQAVASELHAVSNSLTIDRLPRLDQAKHDFMQAYDEMNQYLAGQTSPENWAAWLQYIDAEPLIEQITLGKESPRDFAEMGRTAVGVHQRLVGLAPGLEREPLRKLRTSVGHLIAALRYPRNERSLGLIGKRMTLVAELIEKLDGVPSPTDEALIAALIRVLEESRQAPATASRLRNLFAKPNVMVWVGEDFVQQAIRRNVDEQSPVRDCILGTRIIGNARLTGVVSADLLPAIGTVRLRVELSGCVNSKNTGYNGPVVLRTSGIGQVHATRELTFDESGIRMQPSTAEVSMKNNIDRIEHRLRIVRRIAEKKAAEQKPQTDVIAKQKLHDRIIEEFTKQTDETANVPTPDFMGKVRPVLQRLDFTEPSPLWGSTDDTLFVHSTFCRSDQLSSCVSAPPIGTMFDAAIQLHESVVNNAASPILAGRTLDEARLNELMSRAGRTMPETSSQTEDDQDEPPFEIDFANIRPLIFEARDQRIRIGVSGTRFAQGSRELKRSMEITAIYAPATTADGRVILVREGEVDVDFGSGKRLSVAQAGLRGTIKKKFADVFPAILLDEPLQVPDTVDIDAIRGRVYHPCLITAEDGWLSLAVR